MELLARVSARTKSCPRAFAQSVVFGAKRLLIIHPAVAKHKAPRELGHGKAPAWRLRAKSRVNRARTLY